jgi:hypothetical protein
MSAWLGHFPHQNGQLFDRIVLVSRYLYAAGLNPHLPGGHRPGR